jgi:murein DD-endopeptidase MepM/ murein hydrolase activator NlpD
VSTRGALAAVAVALLALPVSGALGVPDEPAPALPAPAPGSYAWPVVGPVIREFEPPAGPFGAGHRGIDIAAPSGAPVRAAAAGVIAFAGKIAGDLHVSIDHPDGIRTSYAFVGSVSVTEGTLVARGAQVATVGPGHDGSATTHLHFGARFAGQYLDPMLLLERGSMVGMIHLAPVEEGRPETVP